MQKLTHEKQNQILDALYAGIDVASIAREHEVSTRTIQRIAKKEGIDTRANLQLVRYWCPKEIYECVKVDADANDLSVNEIITVILRDTYEE